jgi:signal transduction histidine kinase/ligand-binding sensor domain-containing protein
LFRLDGPRFTGFFEQDGLPGSRVRALLQTRDGTLWVALAEGLAVRQGNRFTAVPLEDGLRIRGPGSLAVDSQGRLYVATTQGLFLADDPATRKFRKIPPPGGPGERGFYSVHIDPTGTAWLGCGLRLCRMDQNRVTILGPESGLPEAQWDAIVTDGAGALWVRSRHRLFVRAPGAAAFAAADQIMPRAGETATLCLDPEGNLVVPHSTGIAFRRGDSWDFVGKAQGLPYVPVRSVLWDREGAPWLGLDAFGVARWLGYKAWTSWTEQDGLPANGVTSIVRDTRGVAWVGTVAGLARLDKDGRWRTVPVRLPHEAVRALAIGSDGGLWVGASEGGLLRVEPATQVARPYGPAEGLANGEIVSLTAAPDGQLWVCTRGGLFRTDPRRKPVRFARQQFPAGHESSTIYRVAAAPRGVLWFAGMDGLWRLADGRWTHFTEAHGLRHRSLVFLALAGDGAVWVGYGNVLGASRLVVEGDALRASHFTHRDALSSSDLSFLETDNRGWVWIGTDEGVDRFDGRNWRRYGPHDGLIWQDTVLGAFLADSDGSVWIGTNRGVSRLRSPERNALAPPPPVVITSAQLGPQLIDSSARSRNGPPDRTFQAGFAALTFSDPQSIRYRYRLVGLGEGWIETDQAKAVFPNLPPGAFTFEVLARGAGNVWSSQPARFEFEILPLVRETWWFRWSLAAASILAARAIWKNRVRRLLETQHRLEAAVLERTSEIEREKATVEQQKVEIERLLAEAREANRLKGEFLANVSHEIRTPMNGVLGMTSLALETEVNPEQREYLETIQSSGRSLLHLLNDILDFSRIEAGKLHIEPIEFSLREALVETLRTVSFSARDRGLGLNYDVDKDVPEAVTLDPMRLRQVLLNLLTNAIKFTPQGSVALRVSRDAENALRFTVSDTGIGISPEEQRIIFDPFRQADGSTTRKYGGTGLGLAISRRLVELMGGRIWVESEPGLGSHFHFTVQLEATPSTVGALANETVEDESTEPRQ